jgi:hypothetical protein
MDRLEYQHAITHLAALDALTPNLTAPSFSSIFEAFSLHNFVN